MFDKLKTAMYNSHNHFTCKTDIRPVTRIGFSKIPAYPHTKWPDGLVLSALLVTPRTVPTHFHIHRYNRAPHRMDTMLLCIFLLYFWFYTHIALTKNMTKNMQLPGCLSGSDPIFWGLIIIKIPPWFQGNAITSGLNQIFQNMNICIKTTGLDLPLSPQHQNL